MLIYFSSVVRTARMTGLLFCESAFVGSGAYVNCIFLKYSVTIKIGVDAFGIIAYTK